MFQWDVTGRPRGKFAAIVAGSVVLHVGLLALAFGAFAYGAASRFSMFSLDDDPTYTNRYRVTRVGEDISLSPTEYNLLRYLLLNQGRVVSKLQILDHVWHYGFGGEYGIVETYVGYLRRKLDTAADGSSRPGLIQTIRGVGYVLREQ